MKKTCTICKKEFEALRESKSTCSASCRQRLHRTLIVTEDKVTVTKPVIVTSGENKLIFEKDTPMKERIDRYKELYPNSSFVPNWVAHGFNSQEEAINHAIKKVRENPATHNLGLGID